MNTLTVCAYRLCKIEFEPKKAGQKFCCAAHRFGEWEAAHPRLSADRIEAVLARAVNPDAQPQPMTAFFNTIKLEGPQLAEANQRASRQEEAIKAFFSSHVGMYTPAEIAAAFPQWPITSIRRAITNLTKRGELVKTSVKRVGAYGQLNHCWSAA